MTIPKLLSFSSLLLSSLVFPQLEHVGVIIQAFREHPLVLRRRARRRRYAADTAAHSPKLLLESLEGGLGGPPELAAQVPRLRLVHPELSKLGV